MNPLHDIIAEEIHALGPISISRFMELCLYHPEHGYYETPDREIGKEGDFYTSVSVGPVFGELLAWQFAVWLKQESGPPYTIIEAGAHDGRLAADILSFLNRHEPKVLADLRYFIIEPSARRRQRQRQLLNMRMDSVTWSDSWDDLPEGGVNGVIFSNELLDAFPVDQFGWDATGRTWFEWRVDHADSRFVKSRGADTDETFGSLPELLEVLPDGFTLETRQAAADWWNMAANTLKSGRLLTIDYGLDSHEFLSPARSAGTIRAYHNHRLADDILARPGKQDLTSHVDFGKLITTGQSRNLVTESLSSQASFLTNLLAKIESQPDSFPDWTPKRLREFQTLAHPAHLGEKFKVLIQRRGT